MVIPQFSSSLEEKSTRMPSEFVGPEHWLKLAALLSLDVCESESASCSAMFDYLQPQDCSLPGSSVHGILQARILEWGGRFKSEGTYVYLWLIHADV